MDQNDVIIVQRDAQKLAITLNRPKFHNAFNRQMLVELTELFATIQREQSLRVVILTGNSRTFCSGADLTMMQESASAAFDENRKNALAIYELLDLIDSCPIPVLGRINGSAFGGGIGIIACCDIAVAVNRAQFAFSETRLGLVPAVISPFVLNKIGSSNARELFLTGERFDAERAREIGLVQYVVNADDLDAFVGEKVSRLMSAAPGAQSAAKVLVRNLESGKIDDVGAYTAELIARLRSDEEGREGMSAFLERRHPNWTK